MWGGSQVCAFSSIPGLSSRGDPSEGTQCGQPQHFLAVTTAVGKALEGPFLLPWLLGLLNRQMWLPLQPLVLLLLGESRGQGVWLPSNPGPHLLGTVHGPSEVGTQGFGHTRPPLQGLSWVLKSF